MNSCELVTYVTAVACALAKCYSKEELSVYSAIFVQLGDTLATMLARDEACSKDDKD